MKMTSTNTTTKRVLVFNPQKRLISINQSAFALARAHDWNVSSIRAACTGKIISYQKLYFRYLAPNITLEDDDMGKLNLEEYDRLCQVERKVYPNGKMSRKGMKYSKAAKEKSPFYPFKTDPNETTNTESQNH